MPDLIFTNTLLHLMAHNYFRYGQVLSSTFCIKEKLTKVPLYAFIFLDFPFKNLPKNVAFVEKCGLVLQNHHKPTIL